MTWPFKKSVAKFATLNDELTHLTLAWNALMEYHTYSVSQGYIYLANDALERADELLDRIRKLERRL